MYKYLWFLIFFPDMIGSLCICTLKNENIIWWLDVRSRIHIKRGFGPQQEEKTQLIFIWVVHPKNPTQGALKISKIQVWKLSVGIFRPCNESSFTAKWTSSGFVLKFKICQNVSSLNIFTSKTNLLQSCRLDRIQSSQTIFHIL